MTNRHAVLNRVFRSVLRGRIETLLSFRTIYYSHCTSTEDLFEKGGLVSRRH